MGNNNFKYTLAKNKDKIILGLAIVGVVGIGFGVFTMINGDKDNQAPIEQPHVDTTNIRAEHIITANDKGDIDLINVETNTVLNSLSLNTSNTIYSRANNLEEVLAYGDGIFYKLTEDNDTLGLIELINLENEEAIKEFKFSNDYIVAKLEDDMLVINLTDKSTFLIGDTCESMIVVENKLIYSKENNIYTYDLDTKEFSSIDVGDITKELIEVDGSIVAFNNFGSLNQKSTILELKDDLYIEKAHRHDNEKLIPIALDSDDKEISYIDEINKGIVEYSHYKLDLSNEKDLKTRQNLQAINQTETTFNIDNTVSTKGYLYTNKSGDIEIFRLTGEVMDKSITNDKDFFMPISID